MSESSLSPPSISSGAPSDEGDTFPPPNNADTQAAQAAELTEPIFDHHARYEGEFLIAEFGPPDADGVYGRNPGTILARPARREDIVGRTS